MLFSSLLFLFLFLPICLLLYYLSPKPLKNTVLFLSSLVFFAWSGVTYSFLLLLSITLNYFAGRAIGSSKKSKLWLSVGVGLNLLLLIVFKYANFIVENLNTALHFFAIPRIDNPSILLPIGISFYTFQAISYLVDVYRKTCPVQRDYIRLGLYISFFPQLIAGPIVRYFDIEEQIRNRTHSIAQFSSGVQRFVLGFAKKVLLANNLGFIADQVFNASPDSLSSGMAWIGILAYTFQIYYDFSGYSDMAIGLARMFGFELLENFNFPYMSKSVREFWHRWHISLSNWFRDYLYIPLGGNRGSESQTLRNLLIVFVLTGFWHGASWNFLIWGLAHGLMMVLERNTPWGRLVQKFPLVLQRSYTFLFVLLAWIPFRAVDFSHSAAFFKVLIGLESQTADQFLAYRLLSLESDILFAIAILGAFGFFEWIKTLLQNRMYALSLVKQERLRFAGQLLGIVGMLFLLLYSTGHLAIESYNPFIYFRF